MAVLQQQGSGCAEDSQKWNGDVVSDNRKYQMASQQQVIGHDNLGTDVLPSGRTLQAAVIVLSTPPQPETGYIPHFYYYAFCYDNVVPAVIKRLSPGLDSSSNFFVDQGTNTCLNITKSERQSFPRGLLSSSMNIRLNCDSPNITFGAAPAAGRNINYYSFSLRSTCSRCQGVNAFVKYKPIKMGGSSTRDDDWAVTGWFDKIAATAKLMLSTQHPYIFLYAFCDNGTSSSNSRPLPGRLRVQQVVRVEWAGEFPAVIPDPGQCQNNYKLMRIDLSSSSSGSFVGRLDCDVNSTVTGFLGGRDLDDITEEQAAAVAKIEQEFLQAALPPCCNISCGLHGTCVGNGTCACDLGYNGTRCEIRG
eukprot:gene7549-7759_t